MRKAAAPTSYGNCLDSEHCLVPVKTYYLELLTPNPHVLAPFNHESAKLQELSPPQPEVNRRMYLEVGGPWQWQDKAQWPLARWRAYVAGLGEAELPAKVPIEEIITVVLSLSGRAAGYFELSLRGADTEIRYFGLCPWAVGQGLGRPLLSAAITRGWQTGAQRLWVHTCELDHPAALPNYQKCGFNLYQTQAE
ncbi:GNAT family N-acetyltransferase [Simiduia sp. 21SJ11W-1]|uniref:GNAT family N-acetyltransferase n=1 Tax=Simiduia sp. 21SJ11W-1 TaxID=2909669 RepID=UPI00209EB4B9|nr:GNAT family N-acetyltransferase [Simiduia sp. 21SJ11W-1]UTA48782.1 GNAT family N-acetyltransferase [Simiduia sp. 21SJ11W-1]